MSADNAAMSKNCRSSAISMIGEVEEEEFSEISESDCLSL